MALNTLSLSVSAPMAQRPLPSLPQEISVGRIPVQASKKQVTFESSPSSPLTFHQQYQQRQQQQEKRAHAVSEENRRKLNLKFRTNSKRNGNIYWDSPFIARIVLAQTVTVAVIFICQCVILVKFGNPVFSMLVGLGIGFWMPLMYTLGLLQTLFTYLLPTYCKVSFACLIQGLISYSAIFMITRDIAYLIHLESYSLYLTEPWILWVIIFLMTCYMSVTSLILLLISIHDICYYRRTAKHPIRSYVVRVKNISQLIKQKQNEKTHEIEVGEGHVMFNSNCLQNQRQLARVVLGRDDDMYEFERSAGTFYGDCNYI